MSTQEKTGQKKPSIKRGRVDSLTIYEVKEEELALIERGSTHSLHFNFAIATISVAATLWVSLFSAQYASVLATSVVSAVAVALSCLGVFFLIWWLMSANPAKKTLATIIKRVSQGESGGTTAPRGARVVLRDEDSGGTESTEGRDG